MCVCVCACVYVRVCVFIYIYIYTYIYCFACYVKNIIYLSIYPFRLDMDRNVSSLLLEKVLIV